MFFFVLGNSVCLNFRANRVYKSNKVVSRYFEMKKTSLPGKVCHSKTSLLKIPNYCFLPQPQNNGCVPTSVVVVVVVVVVPRSKQSYGVTSSHL